MGKENFQTEWVQRAREQDQEALEALYVFCYGGIRDNPRSNRRG